MLSRAWSISLLPILVACAATNNSSDLADRGAATRVCALPPDFELIDIDEPVDGEEQRIYTVADPNAFLLPHELLPEVAAYKSSVTQRFGALPTWRDLLIRQGDVYAKVYPGESANGAAVLGGRAGTVLPASCIEQLLWREQAARWPMLSHPTEMSAFILQHGNLMRIYFSTMNRNGQKIRSAVTSRVESDVASGFVLLAHLHNHPFIFDRTIGDSNYTIAENVSDVGGAIAPSTTDAGFYNELRSLGLKEVWVTNGYETLHIEAADLGELVMKQ
jgi:hypothetical protein